MTQVRPRFSTRHLLAVCTFLLPLGLLAWLGGAELRRQGNQVQAALEQQALTFLRGAAQALEQHLAVLLPAARRESEQALAGLGHVRAVRHLQEQVGLPEVMDLLLLDERGALIAPTPPPLDLGLPLHRSARTRQGPIADALQAAEALTSRGETAAAVKLLQQALEHRQNARRSTTTGPEPLDLDVRLRFQLAVALRALQRDEEARGHFQVLQNMLRPQRTGLLADPSLLGLDLLVDIALAELAGGADGRLALMLEIAEGRRDALPDDLLAAAMRRLDDGLPGDAPVQAAAADARRSDAARRRARSLAADYDILLRETLRRRLRVTDGTRPVLQAFGAADGACLLALRPATPPERSQHGASFICLRLSLTAIAAGPLAPWLTDDGRGFVLALEDADGMPVAGAVDEGTVRSDGPVLQSSGLRLRAVPADPGGMLRQAAAGARTRALLLAAVFCVALVGAVWLWRSVSRAAELAALRVDFVSRISHELKTPLALIRMYGETLGLGRAKDADQVSRFGGIVTREADRLAAMIQRILDFSRQQSGTLTYSLVPTDLGELLAEMVAIYQPQLEAQGASLSHDLPRGIRAAVDTAALESAVLNLLENAAKYSVGPGLANRIELSLHAADGMACIAVADRGRGVPEHERERIFESFYRAQNAGEVRGAGLGLSLVRSFAEAHGGSAAMEPRVGGGATFRIILPLLDHQP